MKKLSENVICTSDVIGKNVIGLDQEKLGKIREIVLDKASGVVRYAVLTFGGFMGVGSEFYAIPWETLAYCVEEDAFKVNFNKEEIKQAPGFNQDSWPDFADQTLGKSTSDFYTDFMQPKSQVSKEYGGVMDNSDSDQPLRKNDI